jgi:hypothetical protein
MPPAGLVGLCGRVVRQSCWGCPGDRIEELSISLILEVTTCQTQMFGVHPNQGIMVSHMDIVACPIFDWGHKAEVCMHIDMT